MQLEGDRYATIWKLLLAVAAGVLFVSLYQTTASALSTGASTYSGNPTINGGETCTSCHSGGSAPAVSISGPTTVDAGTTNTYTLTVTGAQSDGDPRGGLDVSATGGRLASLADQGTQLSSSEIVHTSAKEFTGGNSISWDFEWAAPATAGTASLYGAGLSANGSGTGGDGTGTTQLAITVQAPGATTTTLPAGSGGADVYAVECAACHGANGEGGVGPSLQASTMSLDDTTAIIAGGSASMPGYSDELSPEEVEAVAGFSLSLRDSSGTTTTIPTSGAPLYATWCSACHGASGQGAAGPPLVGVGLSVDEIIAVTRTGAGSMQGFDETLSDGEIEVVAAYLSNLGQVGSPGRALSELTDPAEMYSLGCAACHGVDGQGGIGPAVAGTSFSIQELIGVVSDGAAGMPAFDASMQADQIGALAEFVANLAGDGAIPTTTTTTPGPAASEPTPASDSNSAAGLLVLVFGVLGGVTGGLILWRRRKDEGLAPSATPGEPEESD